MQNEAHFEPGSDNGSVTLDVAGALSLLDNNEDLYQQIAQDFCTELAVLAPRLKALLRPDADPAEAKRMLHTLKGLSLTVGALALSDLCRQGEGWLKTAQASGISPDAQNLAALLNQLISAGDSTLQALTDHLQRRKSAAGHLPANPKETAPAHNTGQLVHDLKALAPLLAANDMRAFDAYADIRKRHGGGYARLEALGVAVHSFDFAQGVVQCQALIRTLSDNN